MLTKLYDTLIIYDLKYVTSPQPAIEDEGEYLWTLLNPEVNSL